MRRNGGSRTVRVMGWMLVACLAATVAAVSAAGPGAARRQAEAGMWVNGWVEVRPDGSLASVEIDERDRYPAGVVALVERAAPHWAFEPVLVEGTPVATRARMQLRVVATRLAGGGSEVSIRNGLFGDKDDLDPDSYVRTRQRADIAYPARAAQAGVQGTVYVVARVGRDGTVEDVVAEQVNLRAVGSDAQMRQMRDLLAQNALASVRRWKFHTPTSGPAAADASWTGRITVDYGLHDEGPELAPRVGQWTTYVPGPKTRAPWMADEAEGAGGADSVGGGSSGEFRPEHAGLRLRTPLDQG